MLENKTNELKDSELFGVDFKPTYNLKKESPDYVKFDAFVLPDGFHNIGFDEAYSDRLHKIARIIHQNGGIIATMCVGVLPISDAGLLKEKNATTCNLSRFQDNVERLKSGNVNYTGQKVEFDNNIISCAGPALSLEVAYFAA